MFSDPSADESDINDNDDENNNNVNGTRNKRIITMGNKVGASDEESENVK